MFSELKFISLRTELLAMTNCFELVGISPLFDEVEPFMKAPGYKIIFNKNKITIERCDKYEPSVIEL